MQNEIDLLYDALELFNDDYEALTVAIQYFMKVSSKRVDKYRILNDLKVGNEISITKYESYLLKILEFDQDEVEKYKSLSELSLSHIQTLSSYSEQLNRISKEDNILDSIPVGQVNKLIGKCIIIEQNIHTLIVALKTKTRKKGDRVEVKNG